ncbi:MAG: cupredoxin domain-containing protein [Acidimicrobiia bacterium]
MDRTEPPAPEPEARINETPPRDAQPRGRGRTALTVLLILGVTVALGVVIALVAANDSGGTPDDFVVNVPEGTGEQVAGDGSDYVDAVIRLEPGQELVLENEDVRLHGLGALSAAPGETVRQTFTTEGRYAGSTSLRSDGRVTILVEQPD